MSGNEHGTPTTQLANCLRGACGLKTRSRLDLTGSHLICFTTCCSKCGCNCTTPYWICCWATESPPQGSSQGLCSCTRKKIHRSPGTTSPYTCQLPYVASQCASSDNEYLSPHINPTQLAWLRSPHPPQTYEIEVHPLPSYAYYLMTFSGAKPWLVTSRHIRISI